MNKIFYYCFATVALLVLTGCASFRINMAEKAYGPHNPLSPAPAFPATEWVDVGNWQNFLVAKGFLRVGKFTLNTFDAATEAATKKFQKTPGKMAKHALPDTGCVNVATYRKAIQEGMPEYKAVRTPDSCATPAKHVKPVKHTTSAIDATDGMYPITPGDTFRDNTMHSGCTGTDVADWQRFLKANGYLSSGFVITGNFDLNLTAPATMQFQSDFSSYGLLATGKVDKKTYAFATSTTIVNLGGAALVSHDGVTPTVESQTNCGS